MDGDVVYEGSLVSIPFDEGEVISYSLLWFNDAEPCFIHRSAVMKRLLVEFDEYLQTRLLGDDGECLWQEVPQPCRVFTFDKDAWRLVFGKGKRIKMSTV
jgi:hypothetical protein